MSELNIAKQCEVITTHISWAIKRAELAHAASAASKAIAKQQKAHPNFVKFECKHQVNGKDRILSAASLLHAKKPELKCYCTN